MTTRQSRRALTHAACAAALAVGVAAGAAPAAVACGYENPADMALGILNWVYPKALYVRTAVWQAENAGILAARSSAQASGPLGFYRAAAGMNGIGKRINASASTTEERVSFSVVLIPAVMWTRFVGNTEGYEVQLHADAPAQDDVVIVTDEKVVRALLDGSLEFAKAEAYGLLRLYGETGQQSAVRTMLAGVARPSATSPADAKHVMPEKAIPQREQ